jgi:serine/threonine protein kinase
VEETFYITWDIIKGLDYIHKKNLIHRDIKAENILLMGKKNNINNLNNNNINNNNSI